ncbi:MAG: sensor domain-containing diguanylate cyclase [Gammaproteobacteria bacterium]|nr:sensor domain-containing diguanylate cyclase [Gammaproteobacteria bacterium]
MGHSVSLRSALLIVSALLVSYIAWSACTGVSMSRDLGKARDGWQRFSALQDDQTRAKLAFVRTIGYGGFIHNYHNYILRKQPDYRNAAWTHLGVWRKQLQILLALSEDDGERAAYEDLLDISEIIGSQLAQIERALASGKSSRDVLNEVDTPYEKAHRAIALISDGFASSAQQGASVKADLRFGLYAKLGFEGFIRSYKRYTILGDETELAAARASIAEVRRLITTYRALPLDEAENVALTDIEETMNAYEQSMDLAQAGVGEGLSPEVIDQNTRVDDSFALRGLALLDGAQARELKASARTVNRSLTHVDARFRWTTATSLAVVTILLVVMSVFISKSVIAPIRSVAGQLMRLAEGDLDVTPAEHAPPNTEVGLLVRALEKLKDNELRRRDAEAELKRIATTDSLTGLVNRGELAKRHKEMIGIAKRKQDSIGLFLVDLDNFKQVNDTFGHHVGDGVLRDVSDILMSEVRETDIAARLGGDEFVVVLYAPESKQVLNSIAERIIERINAVIPVPGSEVKVGASIGMIFDSARNSTDLDRLLLRADSALFRAKSTGKGTVVDLMEVTGTNFKVV